MREDELKSIFSINLRTLLSQHNYGQEEFAEMLNKKYGTKFTQQSISEWVNAKKMPRPIVIEQIGELFGYDASYMLSAAPYVDSIRTNTVPSETKIEKAIRLARPDQQAVASRALKSSPDQLEFLNKVLDIMFDDDPHKFKLLHQYLDLLYDDEGEEKK